MFHQFLWQGIYKSSLYKQNSTTILYVYTAAVYCPAALIRVLDINAEGLLCNNKVLDILPEQPDHRSVA